MTFDYKMQNFLRVTIIVNNETHVFRTRNKSKPWKRNNPQRQLPPRILILGRKRDCCVWRIIIIIYLIVFKARELCFLHWGKARVMRCRFRANINIRIILLSWNLLKLYKYLLHPYFWTRFEILQKHFNSTFTHTHKKETSRKIHLLH